MGSSPLVLGSSRPRVNPWIPPASVPERHRRSDLFNQTKLVSPHDVPRLGGAGAGVRGPGSHIFLPDTLSKYLSDMEGGGHQVGSRRRGRHPPA